MFYCPTKIETLEIYKITLVLDYYSPVTVCELERISWNRSHHGILVKSPGTQESGLGNKLGEKIVLCARCGFQRADRVSTLRVGDSVNPASFPCQPCACAKSALSEGLGTSRRVHRNIPSSNPDHRVDK